MSSAEKEGMSSVKMDNIVESHLFPMGNATRAHPPFCPHHSRIAPSLSIPSPLDSDPFLGEASLMSSPRGFGRPRKIRPEVELHLRTVKNRRRRHSKSGGWDSVQEEGHSSEILTQTALQPWPQPSLHSLSCGSCDIIASGVENWSGGRSEDIIKEHMDRRQMLPKKSCKEESCQSTFMSSNNKFGACPHLRPVTVPKVSVALV